MKYFTHPVIKAAVFCLLLSVSFLGCSKSDTAITPPVKPPVAVIPVVTNVQPKNPMPGDVVTITGTNFGAVLTDVKITIGTQEIAITTVSDTEIKFTLPAGITNGDIAVAIKNIFANNTDPQKATITPQIPVTPTLLINPTYGKVGDIVSITGTSFNLTPANNVVKFNGAAATITGSVGSVLTLTVPAGATTGPVTVSVNGGPVITGPTFTVNSSTGGTAVPYIIKVSGTAKFSKIATAPAEIGAMVIDKKNNILYYSDFTNGFASGHKGTVYKLKLDGSAPMVLSSDARINTVFAIATDADGNVYVEAGLDSQGLKNNIYKIDPASGAITVIASNVTFGGQSRVFTVDSQGGVWLGDNMKLNTTTNAFEMNGPLYHRSITPAFYMGDIMYVEDNYHLTDGSISFYKFNLLTQTGTATDFTLKSLFKQDDPDIVAGNTQNSARYTMDNSENFYAIYPYGGDITSGYNYYNSIRKTKNGGGGASTLITSFYTKFSSDVLVPPLVFYQEPIKYTGILLQADASGNLYMKDNGTDIIKITY